MNPAPMALLVALLAAFVLLAGCADSEPEAEPPGISGAPAQVARVVEALERATSSRDFAAVCGLLTPAARRRAGGDRCPAALSKDVGGVRRPRIRVLSITIRGRRATAVVRATATGRPAVRETLELERLDDGYRIAALAG